MSSGNNCDISHGRLGRYSPKCLRRGCSSKVTGSSPDFTVWRSFLEPTALFREPGALGGPADRDGREDDHERDYDGVDELPDQGAPRIAEDCGEQVLDGRVP